MEEESERNIEITSTTRANLVESGKAGDLQNNIIEAEEVVRYRNRPGRRPARILWALVKIVICLVLAIFIYQIPDFSSNPFYNWKNPIVTFLLVCFTGKTLLDTLFFDHFQP